MLHYANLARRGVEAVRDSSPDVPPQIAQIQDLISEMPPWGLPLLGLTLLAGLLLISSVRYTLQSVMPTLAMIESPQTTVIVREEKQKLEYPDEETIDSEVIVIKQVPITSHIRTTIQHLQARGGFAARWRGLSAICTWIVGFALVKTTFSNILIALLGNRFQPEVVAMLGEHVSSVGAFVILARIGLTWTHIVISEPSAKSWYQRIPSRKAWRQIRAPTFYTALAWQLNKLMPGVVAWSLGFTDMTTFNTQSPETILIKVTAVGLIALVTFVGITIPAEVALTRVQASLLPEEDESIVPFDRTFGGAVVPEIVGGSGKLGYVQAWQTFDGAARLRLLKLYVKVFMVDVALHAFVIMALVTESLVLIGPKAYGLLDQVAGTGAGNVDMAQARYEAVVLGS